MSRYLASPFINADRRQVGRNVRAARHAANVNKGVITAKSYLAGYPTLYEQTIGRIERGERDLSLGEAVALANALGCSLDDLTHGLPAQPDDAELDADNE